jgi:hypothetical protein
MKGIVELKVVYSHFDEIVSVKKVTTPFQFDEIVYVKKGNNSIKKLSDQNDVTICDSPSKDSKL